MAFAGDQHHVGGAGAGQAVGDRLGTVHLDFHVVGAAHAGQDVADDGARFFKARVVVSDDDAVGLGRSDGAHQRALGVVAVTAAAEHTPQQAAALLGQRTQRVQRFLQCVGGMGVIDNRQRRVLAALALQASGYGLQVAASLDRISQTQAQGA